MANNDKDFVVNSKGHCFFCLNKSQSKSEQELSSSLHPLQCLSQYLSMDLTKVFNQKGSIPQLLLAKVKQSRLKVELCEECASWSKQFSARYKQLEKLRMEMDSSLTFMQQKLLKTEKLGGGIKELRRFDSSGKDEGFVEVLDALRMEAMQKCSRTIDSQPPRIKLQNLSKEDVQAYLKTRNNEEESSNSERTITGFGFQSDRSEVGVKIQIEQAAAEVDEENGNNEYFDGIEDDSMSPSSLEVRKQTDPEISTMDTSTYVDKTGNTMVGIGSNATIVTPSMMSRRSIRKQNYTIGSKTGKYRCNLCSKEFTPTGFYIHYDSIHLKIKYKCNLCGKEFSTKPNYNAHLRSAHLGVRFKCALCNQQFTYKQSLKLHQRKTCQ